MDDLPNYDTFIHSPVPLLDQLLSSSPLPWPDEWFQLPPPPVPNNDSGLTSYQIAAPVQENMPSLKVDIKESLIRDLVALISDCRQLGEMIYYIPCAGEVHFEVYGSHGNLQHGFIYLRNHHEGRPPQTDLKLYIDFRDKNYDLAKNLSDKYRMLMEKYEGEWRKDTLSNSIMASAVGSSSIRESYLPLEPDAGYITGTSPVTATERRGRLTGPKKTGLAALSERTKNMRREDLEDYFHLPRERAARELHLSVQTLKRVCRKNGIPRWPYKREGTRKHL